MGTVDYFWSLLFSAVVVGGMSAIGAYFGAKWEKQSEATPTPKTEEKFIPETHKKKLRVVIRNDAAVARSEKLREGEL